MAAPLLLFSLSDMVRSRSHSSQSEEHPDDEGDDGDEREIAEGAEEDEKYRQQLQTYRLSRAGTRESREKGEGANPSGSHVEAQAPVDEKGRSGEGVVEKRSESKAESDVEATGRTSPPPSNTKDGGSAGTEPPVWWRRIGRFIFGAKEQGGAQNAAGPHDQITPKYRWTPIFSGIAQPFSILLEIPGLTEHWYVRQENGVAVAYQENPVILNVGLALSMACGVVANIALINRFLERRVFVSTLVCIIMLSIHDIINIVALAIFGVIHGVDDGFDYSEAFWMCVCSTTASFFTNITLIFDIARTKQFRHSGSGLTAKQRKLVIVVMVLLTYIALGALAFNFLIPEIAFQNALFYTVVSIETIGFGDISPSSVGARVFLFFYVPFGIFNLALAVGTARDTLVESWSAAYRRRRHNVVKRQRERKQQRVEETARLMAAGQGSKAVEQASRGFKGEGVRVGKARAVMEQYDTRDTSGSEEEDEEERYRAALAELCMENEEGYKSFQERMAHEEKMENIWKFGSATGLFVVFWLVGAGIFTRTEDSWDFFTALYFCFVTFTTIGYGDVVPNSPAGRAVFIIWAICGVGIVTLIIAVITEAYSKRYQTAVTRRIRNPDTPGLPQLLDGLSKDQPPVVQRQAAAELPHEILQLLEGWKEHIHVARLAAFTGGPISKEAETMIDNFMASRNADGGQAYFNEPGHNRETFWDSFEESAQRLIDSVEKAVQRVDQGRRDFDILYGPGASMSELKLGTSDNPLAPGDSTTDQPDRRAHV